jgi:hypothetical protein
VSEPFRDVASIDYPVIDCDSHVNEPPDLWQERVPAKWKERAPRVDHLENGDMWIFDGGKEKWPVGLTAVAGLSYFDYKPMGITYETMRRGSFDTKARLDDMDADGIYAPVLYPSVTLKGAKIYSQEHELQKACVRAYNEWLCEFCQGSGGRLVPQAILPTTGLEDSLAEVDWALEHGHRGAVISSFPNGSLDAKPEDDRFWARVQEAAWRRSPRRAARRCPPCATSSSPASSSASRGSRSCWSNRTSAGSRRCSSSPTTCSCATAGTPAR